MKKESKILVTGGGGLIGSALVRRLRTFGFENILAPSRKDLDWSDPIASKWYFSVHEPQFVFHCAARVGGLQDHVDDRVSFLNDNLMIQNNVILNAAEYRVEKLLFLGSSCVYPIDCRRPLREEYLLTGPFEPAVEPYGLAKIIGIKLCQALREDRGCNFVSALPCNTFGINDSIDERVSHVVPGLLLRMRKARRKKGPFTIWGDGTASREMIFSDDLAEALCLIMDSYDGIEPINAGSGQEISISELAARCAKIVDFRGHMVFDSFSPTGTPKKCMDNSKLFSLGWRPRTGLDEALRITYADMSKRLRASEAREYRKGNPEGMREIKRRYRDRHAEEIKARFKKRYHENREKELARHREIKYGITELQYAGLLKSQEGNCAICKQKMVPPQVDHCHSRGQVRGLLCGNCNKALGLMKDSPERLESAAAYLKNF